MSMGNLAKMAQQMQAEMARVQAEVEALVVETSSGGGAVKAVVNGSQEVVSITIDPSAVDPDDVEMLQDLITAAVNDGLHQVRDIAAQKMARVTGGLRLPWSRLARGGEPARAGHPADRVTFAPARRRSQDGAAADVPPLAGARVRGALAGGGPDRRAR